MAILQTAINPGEMRRTLGTIATIALTIPVLVVPFVAIPAAAQDEGAERDDHRIEEVVVRAKRQFLPTTSNAASKLDIPIAETPQALTVISSEFLDIADLNTTRDLVSYTAGVEHAGTGDGTEAILVARGFPIDRERSYRVNGLSVDSEVDFDYYVMDRVEVVRGPASSLYGEADYGATLNRVLKAPSGSFGFDTSVTLGTDKYRRVEADWQEALNDAGSISGRVAMAYQDGDGFIDATEMQKAVIAPSVRFQSADTRLLLHAYFAHHDGSSSDGFPLLARTVNGEQEWHLPDVPTSRNYGADFNRIDSTNGFYYADLEHNFSDSLIARVKGAYSRIDMNNLSTYLFSVSGDGNAGVYASFEDKLKENYSVDASLEKRFDMFGQEQRVLFAADYRRNDRFQPSWSFAELDTVNYLEEPGPYDIPLPDPVFIDTDYFASDRTFYGATALAYLKPSERLSMLLGLRYSGTDTTTDTYRPSANSFTYVTGEDETWVPRAGLTYSFSGDHHVYASYTEGVIFNQNSLDASGEPVDPEQGVQLETGFKGRLFDERLFYTVSAFRIERSDVAAVLSAPPGAPPIYHNVGDQVHTGFEFEFVGEPIPGLNVSTSYAFLDVEVNESANPAEEGQTPRAAPEHSLSVFATYELLEGALQGLTLGGGVVSRSGREVDSVGRFELPSYTRVDLRASYDITDRLQFEANVFNLFDEEIYTSQYASPFLGIAYSQPFRARLGLSYRY